MDPRYEPPQESFAGKFAEKSSEMARIAHQRGNGGGVTTDRVVIQGVLDRQEELIAGAHKLASMLEERLALVLSPMPPSNGGAAKGTVGPSPSQVLDRLQVNNHVIEHLLERLHELETRVQL